MMTNSDQRVSHARLWRSWILSAAVAGLTLGGAATAGWAQQRIGNDGRALDANTRVGSGGINEGGMRLPPGTMGNLIVTGNVTGGQQFRGTINYGDPRAFRGETSGENLDRFISQSAGIPVSGDANNNANVLRPFFGESRAVAPPVGFVQQSPSGGYVPAAPLQAPVGDLRLGQPLATPTISLAQPNQFALPGQVDPTLGRPKSVITASPLFGIRELGAEDALGLDPVAPRRTSGAFDANRLDAMQQELLQRPAGRATEETERVGLNSQPLDSGVLDQTAALQNAGLSGQALSADVQQMRSLRRNALLPPEEQSSQYAQMRQRLEQFRRPGGPSETELNREFTDRFRTTRGPERTGAPSGERPSVGSPATPKAPQPAVGGAPVLPAQPSQPVAEAPKKPDLAEQSRQILEEALAGKSEKGKDEGVQLNKPKPVQVSSLAMGVKAKSLSEILTEAETAMKAGRFNTALDQYDMAQQVAPNNPLVLLGRANAELGASYYGRAEEHLRQAFSQDQALLMAQYDLKSFLGEERLTYIVKDLKEIARTETRNVRPVFLLAYIAYNTGSERTAEAYLDLAEKRSGGQDPVIKLLREFWSLPADEANK